MRCAGSACEFLWGVLFFTGTGGSGFTGARSNDISLQFVYSSSSASCAETTVASALLSATVQQKNVVPNDMQLADSCSTTGWKNEFVITFDDQASHTD